MSKSFLGNTGLTRGIRNNNPGNIKISSNAWLGKIGNDGTFEQFNTVIMGLRACMLNLRTYYNKHGLSTIRQIINRWAPGSENNTGKYIDSVAGFMSVSANSDLNLESKSTLIQLTKAIVKVECSPDHDKISDSDYMEAYDLLSSSSSGSSSINSPLKKSLNRFVIIGVLVSLLAGYFLFKK